MLRPCNVLLSGSMRKNSGGFAAGGGGVHPVVGVQYGRGSKMWE